MRSIHFNGATYLRNLNSKLYNLLITNHISHWMKPSIRRRFSSSALAYVIDVCQVEVNLSLYLIKQYLMKTCGGCGNIVPPFLTLALHGGESSASPPGRLTLRDRVQVTYLIGVAVGPRAGLGAEQKIKIIPLAGNWTPQSIAIWTELPWL
jgi:hypothetical protein